MELLNFGEFRGPSWQGGALQQATKEIVSQRCLEMSELLKSYYTANDRSFHPHQLKVSQSSVAPAGKYRRGENIHEPTEILSATIAQLPVLVISVKKKASEFVHVQLAA
jgi:hypothetical protein